jgi:hypothetical protein
MIKTDLIEIFQTIRAQMQPYTVEGFKNKINTDSAYHLCTEQQVVINELVKNKVYFFGLEVKENYVGLYFRPVYTAKEMDIVFSPDLVKQLKENDCFHITKLDDLLLEQISNALMLGFKFYKQKGWV